MRTSPAGVALIKRFEGFPNGGCPYRDPVGIWTRGYGRIEGIGPNSPCISEHAASRELVALLAKSYEPHVRKLGLPLNQNEFDAVVSAVYNLGPGVLAKGRSLGDALRSHDDQQVVAALMLYVNAGGRPLAGLVRRRRAEGELFVKAVPVRFTKAERRLLAAKLTPAVRLALKAQARRIQVAARASGDWQINDRAGRFRALRRRALQRGRS